MGLFDKFRKQKQETKQESRQEKIPLVLEYSDGTVANVYFDGLCNVSGKTLHQANIEYVHQDGEFLTKKYLLEPIVKNFEDGRVEDGTEEYYKTLGIRPEQGDSRGKYNAVKGFFKEQDITEQKIGSNYIGNLSMKEDGSYYRHYDNEFRTKHIEMTRQDNLIKEQEEIFRRTENEREVKDYVAKQMGEGRLKEELRRNTDDGIDYDLTHPRPGDCGLLTPEARDNMYNNR